MVSKFEVAEIILFVSLFQIIKVNTKTMASIASLQNFPGMCKDTFPSDWFPGCEEVNFSRILLSVVMKIFVKFLIVV